MPARPIDPIEQGDRPKATHTDCIHKRMPRAFHYLSVKRPPIVRLRRKLYRLALTYVGSADIAI